MYKRQIKKTAAVWEPYGNGGRTVVPMAVNRIFEHHQILTEPMVCKALVDRRKTGRVYLPVTVSYTHLEYVRDYKTMVHQGFPLGKGYYLRVYPVWFTFRGNYNVLLAENKAMLAGAKYRNDYDLYAATQHNYEWIIGKNPMAQSTMVGEGHDFVQLYTVQPGVTTGATVSYTHLDVY